MAVGACNLVVGDRSAAIHIQHSGSHIYRAAVGCAVARYATGGNIYNRTVGSIDGAASPCLTVHQFRVCRNVQSSGLYIQYTAILMALSLTFGRIPLFAGIILVATIQLQVLYRQDTVGLNHAAHVVKSTGDRSFGSIHARIDKDIACIFIQCRCILVVLSRGKDYRAI